MPLDVSSSFHPFWPRNTAFQNGASLGYSESMNGASNIAAIASLLANPGRCRILFALADGRALPASRLATEAGVAPSTASVHLAKLVQGGLIIAVPPPPHHGRYHFFQLAGPEVAGVLEGIARIAPPTPIRSLRDGTRAAAMRMARTCYDHLAGRLGAALTAALIERRVLAHRDGTYRLTDQGEDWLVEFGIDLPALRTRRRPLIHSCIDWTEQRPHLSGALGAALLERLFEHGWLRRSPASRAIHLTEEGRASLKSRFGLTLDEPDGAAVTFEQPRWYPVKGEQVAGGFE